MPTSFIVDDLPLICSAFYDCCIKLKEAKPCAIAPENGQLASLISPTNASQVWTEQFVWVNSGIRRMAVLPIDSATVIALLVYSSRHIICSPTDSLILKRSYFYQLKDGSTCGSVYSTDGKGYGDSQIDRVYRLA